MSTSGLLQASSINLLTVLPGDTVTITGSGLSTELNQNIVTFAGTADTSIKAVVQSATPTTIIATVPGNILCIRRYRVL